MNERYSESGIDLADLEREALLESEESAYALLRENWLASTVAKLRAARRQAGLTQGDLAARLETTQSAIARLEADHEGRMTLHRFIDYAVACGVLALDMLLVPSRDLRAYALQDPDAPRTQTCFDLWRLALPTGNASPVGRENQSSNGMRLARISPININGAPADFGSAEGSGHLSQLGQQNALPSSTNPRTAVSQQTLRPAQELAV